MITDPTRVPSRAKLPNTSSRDSLSIEEDSTSTKVSSYSSPYFRTCDNTPNAFEDQDLRTTFSGAKNIDIKGLEIDTLAIDCAKEAAKNKMWDKALAELHKIQNPTLRDTGYIEITKIATLAAANEIATNTSKTFHSPTTLKAYRFCHQIANPTERRNMLEHIDQTLKEDSDDFIEEPITADLDRVLADFRAWDLAKVAAIKQKWYEAQSLLDSMQDSLWKDSAYSDIAKLATNAAIDVADNKELQLSQNESPQSLPRNYRPSISRSHTNYSSGHVEQQGQSSLRSTL